LRTNNIINFRKVPGVEKWKFFNLLEADAILHEEAAGYNLAQTKTLFGNQDKSRLNMRKKIRVYLSFISPGEKIEKIVRF
jgi:hypothetical protein